MKMLRFFVYILYFGRRRENFIAVCIFFEKIFSAVFAALQI